MENINAVPSRRALEFGIYRDGDNNLDAIQETTLSQALETSRADARIEFPVARYDRPARPRRLDKRRARAYRAIRHLGRRCLRRPR